MIENVFVINKLSQMKAINSELKLQIINELVLNPATGQQLSNIFGLSKQKIHYNLKTLLDANLVKIINTGNNKEVYYRAKAKNYILDLSLNNNGEKSENNRTLINQILISHNIDLARIAANLLENSLKLKAKEKLLIVSGEYNMPLVKKILIEASKRQIETTLMYRDKELLKAKHNLFSLATYNWDFEKFNRALKNTDVYLYLNGESRFIPLDDPEKKKIQQKAFAKSRDTVKKNNIRIAMMEGLMHDELTEENILSEINFWKSLDVDYKKLAEETMEASRKYIGSKTIRIQNNEGSVFVLKTQKVICDYGSYTDLPRQCPLIFIPGGDIMLIPEKKSFNGIIKAKTGYIYGKTIKNPSLKIVNNEIVEYQAEENEKLIAKAIVEGGPDGRKISLISLGTNYNMNKVNIDPLYKCKSKGMMSIRWGENVSIGGSIKGYVEWQIQLENPKIKIKRRKK
ncbi:MAG: winged helix-turn-helix domain-containing protein [Candidatus Cloacimonetes bacterium]|nr:winged helix-turn-helix domain-containing protein [Candidatus Cloacimonadota bacterium]